MQKIHTYLNMRSGGEIKTGAIVFSNTFGMLGMTEDALELIEEYKSHCQQRNEYWIHQ